MNIGFKQESEFQFKYLLLNVTREVHKGWCAIDAIENPAEKNGGPVPRQFIPRRVTIKIMPITGTDDLMYKKTGNEYNARMVAREFAPSIPSLDYELDVFYSNTIPDNWNELLRTNAKLFFQGYQEMKKDDNYNANMKVLYKVTEWRGEQTLHDYIRSLTKDQPISLELSQIRSYAFQLAFALYKLNRNMFFAHLNMRPENVVLNTINESRAYVMTVYETVSDELKNHSWYRFVSDYKKWILFLGPETGGDKYADIKLPYVPHEVRLKNFTLSNTDQSFLDEETSSFLFVGVNKRVFAARDLKQDKHYVNHMPPEIFFLHQGLLHNGGSLEDQDVEFDLWSLGILIIEMCLAGWSKPDSMRHDAWSEDKRYPIEEHANVLNLYANASTNVDKQLEKIRKKNKTIEILYGICMLNKALGNGILPSLETWPYLKNSTTYALMSKMRNLEFFTRHTTGNKPLYDCVVERVGEKIGKDGVDLVRRLLTWNPRDRLRLGIEDERFHKHKYLYPLITHPFFRELRYSLEYLVDARITTPIIGDASIHVW